MQSALARIPPKVRAAVYPVCEEHGLILAYFNAEGDTPAKFVPQLDVKDWSTLRSNQRTPRSYSQETTENSVDVGHFSEIHPTICLAPRFNLQLSHSLRQGVSP